MIPKMQNSRNFRGADSAFCELMRDTEGATLIEYAVLIAFIAIIVVGLVSPIALWLIDTWQGFVALLATI